MTMLRLEDLDFDLPEELIAQEPLANRSDSRLLVVDRRSGALSDRKITDLTELIGPEDVLVLNDTKVIPARLFATKQGTGGRIEILLLESVDDSAWRAMVRPGRRMQQGATVEFPGEAMTATVLEVHEDGTRTFLFEGEQTPVALAERAGQMPLPPYIKRPVEQASDRDRYQTVYAQHAGAVAAPTAGLHFTPELLGALESAGVEVLRVTLHVGLGTFAPLTDREIASGHLHEERYELTADVAERLNRARAEGKRIVAVGSTSTRVLETVARAAGEGPIETVSGRTDVFLQPGDMFHLVDAMLTNFHLPRSSLFALVCAFGGMHELKSAYAHAIAQRYRFYSYGDAMLIA